MDKPIRAKFMKAAKQAVAGLKSADVMVGMLDDRDTPARWEFILQVGYCLLHNKPLVLIVPTTLEIPEKLRAAATVIETYRMDDPESAHLATKRALLSLGKEAVH